MYQQLWDMMIAFNERDFVGARDIKLETLGWNKISHQRLP
jgi:hypothetical protein